LFFACLSSLLLLLVLVLYSGRLLIVDQPQASDVIVVLAGGGDDRYYKGLELLEHGYGRVLFLDARTDIVHFGRTPFSLGQMFIQGSVGNMAKQPSHVSRVWKLDSGRSEAPRRLFAAGGAAPRAAGYLRLPHPARFPDRPQALASIPLVCGRVSQRLRFRSELVAAPRVGQNHPAGVDQTAVVGSR
jgi:hypothetical protein